MTKKNKRLSLAEQFRGAATELHPLVSMMIGMMHGLNSFIALFEAAKPDRQTRQLVNHFIGTTLIAIGTEYKNRVEDEEQATPESVPPVGGALGDTNE